MAQPKLGQPVTRRLGDLLVAEGHLDASEIPTTDGYKPPTGDFIDGVVYDGREPNAYLAKFAVGLQGKSGKSTLAANEE